MTKNIVFNIIMELEKNNKFSLKQETNGLKNRKTIKTSTFRGTNNNRSRNPPLRHVRMLRW